MNIARELFDVPQVFEGQLNARGFRFALVVSRFNSIISERLLEGALDALNRTGANTSDIHVYRVPGSFEIPLVARKLATTEKYDAVICLGALVRGDTPHFDFISAEVTKGVAQTAMESGVPVQKDEILNRMEAILKPFGYHSVGG